LVPLVVGWLVVPGWLYLFGLHVVHALFIAPVVTVGGWFNGCYTLRFTGYVYVRLVGCVYLTLRCSGAVVVTLPRYGCLVWFTHVVVTFTVTLLLALLVSSVVRLHTRYGCYTLQFTLLRLRFNVYIRLLDVPLVVVTGCCCGWFVRCLRLRYVDWFVPHGLRFVRLVRYVRVWTFAVGYVVALLG